MAIRKAGKRPATKETKEAEAPESASHPFHMAKAKLTMSMKRRLPDGSEIFVAPGIECDCSLDDLDATQADVEARVTGWMTTLMEAFPDSELDDDDEEEEDDEEEDDEVEADDEEEEDEDEAEEEADEEEEDDEEEDDEEEEELEVSEEDIAKMKLAELKALIKDAGLDLDAKGMKVAELREAVADELFGEAEEEDEDEDEDEVDDEEEEDDGEEDGDELTEEDLQEMKLAELQALCEEYEIEEPSMPRGAKLSAKKKLYIDAILNADEEED